MRTTVVSVGLLYVFLSVLCGLSHAVCVDGETTYQTGDTYNPEPCTTCTCTESGHSVCVSRDCSFLFLCPDGSVPVPPPGQCCPVCNSGV